MRGRVLILAGTAEARAVCAASDDLDVLASLAGATAAPRDLGVPTRIGGFGGEAAFAEALGDVSAVLDATHPFASRMSERAARLCAENTIPHLRLTRPPWTPSPAWARHANGGEAARALPRGARVFLAVGPGGLDPFLGRGLQLFCRRVDPAPPHRDVTWLIGLPGDEAQERALLAGHGITHLVTKDSGGPRGKLDGAASLAIAVHLIDRPPPAPGEETHDIDRAIAFVRTHAAARPDHRDAR